MSDLSEDELAELEQVFAGSIGRIPRMVAEIRRHRTVAERLEAWAGDIKAGRVSMTSTYVAAELRNRMKEPGQ